MKQFNFYGNTLEVSTFSGKVVDVSSKTHTSFHTSSTVDRNSHTVTTSAQSKHTRTFYLLNNSNEEKNFIVEDWAGDFRPSHELTVASLPINFKILFNTVSVTEYTPTFMYNKDLKQITWSGPRFVHVYLAFKKANIPNANFALWIARHPIILSSLIFTSLFLLLAVLILLIAKKIFLAIIIFAAVAYGIFFYFKQRQYLYKKIIPEFYDKIISEMDIKSY